MRRNLFKDINTYELPSVSNLNDDESVSDAILVSDVTPDSSNTEDFECVELRLKNKLKKRKAKFPLFSHSINLRDETAQGKSYKECWYNEGCFSI